MKLVSKPNWQSTNSLRGKLNKKHAGKKLSLSDGLLVSIVNLIRDARKPKLVKNSCSLKPSVISANCRKRQMHLICSNVRLNWILKDNNESWNNANEKSERKLSYTSKNWKMQCD